MCCIPDSAFISPLVLSAKEQALCFLLGVTVNQPVFMRGKPQPKEFLVECIEVHDHDTEGEWSGSVTMPGKVTGRSLLFHIRAVWKRVHSEDYVEDHVIYKSKRLKRTYIILDNK